MTLHIAVCDDEKAALEYEADLVSKILYEKKANIELSTYNSPSDLLSSGKIYDMVFLDIEMDGMNGIELAEKIREKNENCFVFFITNYSLYLDRAFDVRAIRYLTKPVDPDRLSSGIDYVLDSIASASKKISVTNFKNKLTVEIKTADIIYVSNSGRHAKIVTKQYEFETEEVFSAVKQMIEKEVNYFAAPHQSYYVNLRYVTGYTKTDVKMSYGGRAYKTMMSRRRYKDFDIKFFEAAKVI